MKCELFHMTEMNVLVSDLLSSAAGILCWPVGGCVRIDGLSQNVSGDVFPSERAGPRSSTGMYDIIVIRMRKTRVLSLPATVGCSP